MDTPNSDRRRNIALREIQPQAGKDMDAALKPEKTHVDWHPSVTVSSVQAVGDPKACLAPNDRVSPISRLLSTYHAIHPERTSAK